MNNNYENTTAIVIKASSHRPTILGRCLTFGDNKLFTVPHTLTALKQHVALCKAPVTLTMKNLVDLNTLQIRFDESIFVYNAVMACRNKNLS